MPFFMETETARINRLIRAGAGAGLTELEFFAREIVAWEKSGERREQITGMPTIPGIMIFLPEKEWSLGLMGSPWWLNICPTPVSLITNMG